VAIIGGGPAGISAGIYAARRGLKAALFEGKLLGGAVNEASEVDNWPGVQKAHGMELAQKFAEHLRTFPVDVKEERVEEVRASPGGSGGEGGFTVKTTKGRYGARAVIIATGAKFQSLDAPGEKELAGRGVSYCATCDGYFFKDKRVAVVGGGDSALSSALYLSDIAKEVLLIHRRGEFRAFEELQERVREKAEAGKMRILLNKVVAEIRGKQLVESVVLEDVETKEKSEEKVDGVFIYVGAVPLSVLAQQLGVQLNEKGFVRVGDDCSTNVHGVFAAGDVTGKLLQITMAVAQGAQAALAAYSCLREKK